MKSLLDIVDGGGWIVRRTHQKPKARLFLFLSVIWLVVSIPASVPFPEGWPMSFSEVEWLGALLIAPHPIFIVIAIVCWRRERPRLVEDQRANPDYDLRKLY